MFFENSQRLDCYAQDKTTNMSYLYALLDLFYISTKKKQILNITILQKRRHYWNVGKRLKKENVIKKIHVFNTKLLYFKGLQCSRCPSFNQCHGCIVQRMGRITLQPGDHLTVMLNNISTKQLDELMQQYVIDHDSMENLRPDTPMSIYDCFRAFMQR